MPDTKVAKIPLIMESVLNTPWAILPEKLEEIMLVLQTKNIDMLELQAAKAAGDNSDSESDEKDYEIVNGIAAIQINGTLSKRMNIMGALSGGTSYERMESQIKGAEQDSGVQGIFLDIDSPGGNVDGVFNTADTIFSYRGEKPILAYANGLMASAAYLLGAAADYVVLSDRAAQVGSIGIITVHLDKSKQLEKDGVKPTIIHAGAYKKEGNPFEPLKGEAKKHIQADVDYAYTLFVNSISQFRDASVETVLKEMADGRMFTGLKAIEAGLADEIANRDTAMQLLRDVINGKKTFQRGLNKKAKGGVSNMSDENMEKNMKELQLKLDAANTKLAGFDIDAVATGLKGQIADLTAKNEELSTEIAAYKTSDEASTDKLAELEASIADDKVFVVAGKKAFDDKKAAILLASAQVDGKEHNADLVTRQLGAFGTDMEALNQFEANLVSRRGKMVLAGTLDPDESQTTGEISQKTAAEQKAIGAALVPQSLRIVQ